jgi:hypothetical protein
LIIPLFEAPWTSAAAQEMIVLALQTFFAMLSNPPTKHFYWLVDLSISFPAPLCAKALVEFCDFTGC